MQQLTMFIHLFKQYFFFVLEFIRVSLFIYSNKHVIHIQFKEGKKIQETISASCARGIFSL